MKNPKTEYTFTATEKGYTFKIRDEKFSDDKGDLPEDEKMSAEEQKMMDEMFKSFMKGFEWKSSVTLPGTIQEAKGYASKKDRKAFLRVYEKNITKKKDFEKYSSRNVVCGPSQVTKDEIAAFKKELEKAKIEFEELKKEMKKRAAEKKTL